MFELTLDRLPGGDPSRRTPLLKLAITNTGEGLAGVKVYAVEVAHADQALAGELARSAFRTHRDQHESALRLAHRILGQLLRTDDSNKP